MLTLKNGHSFSIACASGALAYGSGYWWEKHFLIPLGIIQPKLFTIITKTVTFRKRDGNLRWWPPCVWPLRDGGAVNAVGLTNPGYRWLYVEFIIGQFPVHALPTIISISADNHYDAEHMCSVIDKELQDRNIVGIELNPSCPNVVQSPASPEEKTKFISKMVVAAKQNCNLPIGVKLGYLDPYQAIGEEVDGIADWLDLINTIKWNHLHPKKPSPLVRWGYEGGVSGPQLTAFARHALTEMKVHKTPIISGGGIMDSTEAIWRLQNGAAAVTIGSLFLTRPWRVNQIARDVIKWDYFANEARVSSASQ